MDHELQIVSGRSVDLIGSEHALEHDDWMRDARCPQGKRFLDARDGEGVRGPERTRRMNETVTVGVGFDRGDDARRRSEAADDRKIVAQRGCVDRDDGNAVHASP